MAIEAVVVGEVTNHRVVGQAKFRFITIIIHGPLNHVIRLVAHEDADLDDLLDDEALEGGDGAGRNFGQDEFNPNGKLSW